MKNSDMPATACTVIEETKNSMGSGTKKVTYKGLTKREAFAIAAMQGILSSETEDNVISIESVVRFSASIADSLLAELEK